jgi:hypothetical protein
MKYRVTIEFELDGPSCLTNHDILEQIRQQTVENVRDSFPFHYEYVVDPNPENDEGERVGIRDVEVEVKAI